MGEIADTLIFLAAYPQNSGCMAILGALPEAQLSNEDIERTRATRLWLTQADAYLQSQGIRNDASARDWIATVRPKVKRWHQAVQKLDAEVVAKVEALGGLLR